MPRGARKISETKIYHCILRGINKQDIFLDEQDYIKFTKEIRNTKEFFSYKLYSYVLMSNHIHLHIKDEQNKISKIMQSLQVRYTSYFNKKYNRVGHLFQNRFQSKCVENDFYNLNLIRYIHQNPIKAGISQIENYYWSSYLEYISNNSKDLIEKNEILKLFSKNKNLAILKFIKFNNEILYLQQGKDILEYEIKTKLNDAEVIECIRRKLKINNIEEIQNYENNTRKECIRKVKEIEGCTYSQLSRILGINIKVIQRA